MDVKVLIVEDNPINQKTARAMLQKLGCEVQIAENGRESVEVLASASFDLILMDCHMPEMDGFEATRSIRRAGCSTPIIAVTASVFTDGRQCCLEAGMNDYLTKPIRMETLAALLAKWTQPAWNPSKVYRS